MCNLYAITRGQEAMRRRFAVARDILGNQPPAAGRVPRRQVAPVVRVAEGVRELATMRWGMPGPSFTGGAAGHQRAQHEAARTGAAGSGRGTAAWCRSTSFCEYAPTAPRKTSTWFALDESRPLFAFAGIWTTWTGTRGTVAEPVKGEHALFGFLTTEANGVVGPVHPKAMPVLLTTADEFATWMEAPWAEASALQRPLPDAMLRIVASGDRRDSHADP